MTVGNSRRAHHQALKDMMEKHPDAKKTYLEMYEKHYAQLEAQLKAN